jgi:hypothetical protein
VSRQAAISGLCPDPIRVVRWWPGDGRSGGRFEGDLVAEDLQLADVVAPGALRTKAGVVAADAQSWNRTVGSASRCQTITRMDRPTATIARLLPRRRAIRRSRAPRKVSVLLAATATSPSTRASYGLPRPVDPRPSGLPADSLTPGANLAHDTRCPAVGNRARFRPDRGKQQACGGLADPTDLLQPLNGVGERGDQLGQLGVELGQLGVQGVHPAQQLAHGEARVRPCRWVGCHGASLSFARPVGVPGPEWSTRSSGHQSRDRRQRRC